MEKIFRKPIGISFVCFIFVVTIFAGIPYSVMAADTIKIGLTEPLSGPHEPAGRAYMAGVQFAVDEQNAKGGLFGKKIEIIAEDNELKADVGARKAKKLILEHKVNFLAQGAGSHIGLAVNRVANDEKILYINHGAGADILTGKEFTRYAFRVCFSAHAMATAHVIAMANKPYKRYYVLCPDYAFGRAFANDFMEQMKIRIPDAKIVGEDYPPLLTREYAPYITKAIAANAEVIVNSVLSTDLINLVRQARQTGFKPPHTFVGPGIVDTYVMHGLKDDGVGFYYATTNPLRLKTPENEEFIRRFHERHKNDKDFLTWWPTGWTGIAAVGWKMVFAAVEKAGSLDTEKIIETFEGFQWKSPFGLYTMRKCDHQVIQPWFGGVMEGGPNPYFNGSIRPEVNFPWEGRNVEMIPANEVVIPATPDYNPRCR